MCPTKAISIAVDTCLGIYLPKIDSSKCNSCALCYNVCPGEVVNFKELSKSVYPQQDEQPNSILLGNYTGCYVGCSADSDVRFSSSSGGIISQLLISALEAGLIDGALVTRMHKDQPLEPEPFIARTHEEILEASTSKYCPVPVNVALKEVLDRDGRYAFVGLPCHIHGLRKAQQKSKKLRDRIVLTIGIFCSHNDSFGSTSYMLRRLNVRPSDVERINYRGQGWPGVFSVKQKSGVVAQCAFHNWIKVHEYCFFTPNRCLVCCDHAAELADISAGDAWLPEYSKDHIGTSVFISRNVVGDNFLKLAQSKGELSFAEIDPKRVAKSQGNVRFKKNGYAIRSFIFKLQRKSVPYYNIKLPKSGLVEIPRSAIIFVNRTLTSMSYFNQNIDRLISLQVGLKKLYASSTNSSQN